jgi:glycosyltransferase involved in cell wall biosynthesis
MLRNGHSLRVAFIMEQILGHVSHDLTLRSVINNRDDIQPTWISVSYQGQGFIERLKLVPSAIRSTARGAAQVREGIRAAAPHALFFHTQKPAVLQPDLLLRYPSILSLDVTPKQYDELGEFYEHEPDTDGPAGRLKHQMNRFAFGRARRIVAWSNWVRDSLINDYGVTPRRIEVIPPGVGLTAWGKPRPRAEERRPRILFVGGDFGRKGGELLLDWFDRQGRGLCELDIVTRSPVEGSDDIRIHRAVSPNSETARELFHSADIFVLPSLGECFGIAAVEAMAAGIPVVMTRVGGAADIVDHGVNGLLVPPGDVVELGHALNHLVLSRQLRLKMGDEARKKAERSFDAVRNAERLLECIREAVHLRLARERRTPTPALL